MVTDHQHIIQIPAYSSTSGREMNINDGKGCTQPNNEVQERVDADDRIYLAGVCSLAQVWHSAQHEGAECWEHVYCNSKKESIKEETVSGSIYKPLYKHT